MARSSCVMERWGVSDMTVETLAPGTKTLRRSRALETYLVHLDEELRRLPPHGGPPPKIKVGQVSVLIEPWIVARVRPQSTISDDGLERTALLRQSLALWLKSSRDVNNLRRSVDGGSENLYALQAELMLDSAVGSTLLREIQDSVDDLVKKGALDEARRFSKFQHQARCVCREIKHAIAESNGKLPDELVEPSTDQQPVSMEATRALMSELEEDPPPPRRRRRPARADADSTMFAARKKRYRTEILIGLDVLAILACLVVAASRTVDKTPRALTLGDFPNAAPLIEIVARPPTLYANLDAKAWSEYDDKQKRRLVDGMGGVLLTNGYWGGLLRTTDGRLIAEWLENGGTRLLGDGAGVRQITADPSAPQAATPQPDVVAAQYSRFVP